jgi:hypothetical protein
LPLTLFIPGIPPGAFNGKVLGDNTDTGPPREEAVTPPLILGSYFGVAGNLVFDGKSFVATGFNGSGMSLLLEFVYPSRI